MTCWGFLLSLSYFVPPSVINNFSNKAQYGPTELACSPYYKVQSRYFLKYSFFISVFFTYLTILFIFLHIIIYSKCRVMSEE